MTDWIDSVKQEIDSRARRSTPAFVENTALIVVDMINEGCREGGLFHKAGFDISLFNAIENNVRDLANFFASVRLPVVYVTSFYDREYLPSFMASRFDEMGLPPQGFSAKGSWGVEFVDTLPLVHDAVVIKSQFSAFARGFSLLKHRNDSPALEDYLSAPAEMDRQKKKAGISTLPELYERAVISEHRLLEGLEDKARVSEVEYPSTLFAWLKAKGVKMIVLSGGSTHVCLAATAYSALHLGFEVILPVDAIASENPNMHWMYLENMSTFFATVTTVEKLTHEQKRTPL